MHRILLQPADDLDSLGRRWAALEPQAGGGFFRSWTFLGCMAAQRFRGASLLAVTQDGADVALALLGRGRRRLALNETASAAHDAVFIEHNGLLCTAEAAPAMPAALRAARKGGRLVLSGIDETTLAAARSAGWLHVRQSRWAPAVALDLAAGDYLATLSANARAQIRRSMRLYGPDLHLARAASLEQAQAWFGEMVALHTAAWRARGQPGAFATDHMMAFHRALIARAWGKCEADLLRVTAGSRHLGTLYMLVRDGRAACYQSGFVFSADAREKPGLVCHTLAIKHYVAAGARIYDLLAGPERYKLTLANSGENLHWATLHAPWSPTRLLRALAS